MIQFSSRCVRCHLEVGPVIVYLQTTCIFVIFCRDRQAAGKANRKLEKKMKEIQLQADDEKRHAEQCKDQVHWLLII